MPPLPNAKPTDDLTLFAQDLPLQDFVSSSTVQDFQNRLLDLQSGGFMKGAIAVQVLILFECRTSLSSWYRPGSLSFTLSITIKTDPSADLLLAEAAAIQTDFRALDTLINKYWQYLILMDQLERNQPYETCCLLTYTLGHIAMIQLHSPFASQNVSSNQKCLAAAFSVVRVLDTINLNGILFLNPIMGVSANVSRGYCGYWHHLVDIVDNCLRSTYCWDHETQKHAVDFGFWVPCSWWRSTISIYRVNHKPHDDFCRKLSDDKWSVFGGYFLFDKDHRLSTCEGTRSLHNYIVAVLDIDFEDIYCSVLIATHVVSVFFLFHTFLELLYYRFSICWDLF